MEPTVKKRPHLQEEEEEEEEENREPNAHCPFVQCSHLILPWLTPQELANTSLACKTLSNISKSINLQRSLDATRSMETHPIPFHNPLNDRPFAYFLYTPHQILSSQSPSRQSWGTQIAKLGEDPVGGEFGGCGCECDGCGDSGSDCLEEEEVGIMGECGPSCGCGMECGNRLTQRGVPLKVKIVRDQRKGWGLFADQLICRGQFVCVYAGELLTTEEARKRQKMYDELASGGQFSSALLVVREHLPSGKACLRINIDATRIGNVARFINHSCDGGNLSTILVRSSGEVLPRLCFFASRDIKAGEELTFSYGGIRVRSKGLKCFCGSSCCFGTLPSENT